MVVTTQPELKTPASFRTFRNIHPCFCSLKIYLPSEDFNGLYNHRGQMEPIGQQLIVVVVLPRNATTAFTEKRPRDGERALCRNLKFNQECLDDTMRSGDLSAKSSKTSSGQRLRLQPL